MFIGGWVNSAHGQGRRVGPNDFRANGTSGTSDLSRLYSPPVSRKAFGLTLKLAGASEQFLTIRLVTGGAQQMFNPLMLLAAEANAVIALRMMKLMRGGRSARREANLMVREKINAAFEATASLVAGASGDEIVHRYRQHVAKNAKRLSGRGRNRVLKRTRRRRK